MSQDCQYHDDTQHFDAERDALHKRVVERRRIAAVDAATVVVRNATRLNQLDDVRRPLLKQLLSLEDEITADPQTFLTELFDQARGDLQAIEEGAAL